MPRPTPSLLRARGPGGATAPRTVAAAAAAARRRPAPALLALGLALAGAAGSSQAHVTLPPGGATAGSVYPAAFRVGHACKDASATTALVVRVPAGFEPLDAPPRPGWRVSVGPQEVRWTAEGPAQALPDKERARFVVRGRLTGTPGTLWFKVRQACDRGEADWSEVPASDSDKPAFPAARLEVLAPGLAPVEVREPWARATVAGQGAAGVYAQLTAGAGARLVGGRSPLAAAVEVHEMRMEGSVMRMRELADGLPLPPAEPVTLAPGGLHLMLTGLKQPLAAGSVLPLTLQFVDADGRRSERTLEVPVRAADAAPAGAGAAGGGHAHH
ncbi:copper chaperone PCu(A)C [Piscinibacter sakaiensis]|uniref:Copper metallochaperone n=1 Tax=Piscinibacter sakaiensis TaxID=1547922 RepID=A0A0K8P879_PISS1|nr:copper chaperone PCu(A)C [Piscinibacter sakaiensis]GAP38704.1 copper metallochaperone [Piscinibacter sakaiensis]